MPPTAPSHCHLPSIHATDWSVSLPSIHATDCSLSLPSANQFTPLTQHAGAACVDMPPTANVINLPSSAPGRQSLPTVHSPRRNTQAASVSTCPRRISHPLRPTPTAHAPKLSYRQASTTPLSSIRHQQAISIPLLSCLCCCFDFVNNRGDFPSSSCSIDQCSFNTAYFTWKSKCSHIVLSVDLQFYDDPAFALEPDVGWWWEVVI